MNGKSLSTKQFFAKRFTLLPFDGIWKDCIGDPEDSGAWIIYGSEKHGKTTFALMMASYLSKFGTTEYISAEEGLSYKFREAVIRSGIKEDCEIKWREYTPLDEVITRLKSRKSARFVFFDNMTVYQDDFQFGGFSKLLKAFPDKLFIFIAHEEKGKPYTAPARLCKKLAKVIARVEGLAVFVSGRGVPGGILEIDEQKSKIYHGQKVVTK